MAEDGQPRRQDVGNLAEDNVTYVQEVNVGSRTEIEGSSIDPVTAEENFYLEAESEESRTKVNEISGGTHKLTIQSGVFEQFIQTFQGDLATRKTRPPLKPGTFQISSHMTVLEKEPISTSSRVFRAILHSVVTGDKIVIVKITPADEKHQREAKIHFSVPHHKNIVKRIATDVFDFRGQSSIYIAMEQCDCNLHDHIKSQVNDKVPFDAKKYLSICRQIVVALNFLHSHNVVHGNLKPGNVLLILDENIVKLCDFGLSRAISDDKTSTDVSSPHGGTTGWQAPESLKGTIKIGFKSDIFPLGLVTFHCLSYGKHPYGDKSVCWNHYIVHGENRNLEGMLIPDADAAKLLLELMMVQNPADRPTAKDVLKHPLFADEGRLTLQENINKQRFIPSKKYKVSSTQTDIESPAARNTVYPRVQSRLTLRENINKQRFIPSKKYKVSSSQTDIESSVARNTVYPISSSLGHSLAATPYDPTPLRKVSIRRVTSSPAHIRAAPQLLRWDPALIYRTTTAGKKTTLRYGWCGFGLTLLIAVCIGIWLRVDIEKEVPVSARPIADQPSIRQEDQDLAAVLKRRIETEAFKEQIIGPEGGSVENFGCKITFPAGAVERESKIKMSVITDFSGSPEGMAPITPILQCVLDNNLKAPVLVEMSSWAQPSESGVQGHLYRKDEDSDWTFVELVSLSSDGKISFSTKHFTWFSVFFKSAAAVGGMIVGGGIQTIRSLPCSHSVEVAMCSRVQRSTGLPILLKTFLRVNADGRVAFVCCLSYPKVIGDVESSFKDCGYIYALLMPETRTVLHDEQFSLVISCNFPDTLKIRENRRGEESTERKCERNIKVSELLNKMQHIEYFPLEINGKNLKYHKGEIRALFALKNGGLIEHPISVQWPPPILE